MNTRVANIGLSVVVSPTEGGNFLEGALAALAAQERPPPFEIIVPVDSSISGVEGLRKSFTNVRFVDVKNPTSLVGSLDIGISHIAIDQRRAAGLAAARGEIVALTEEHARPARDWCAQLAEAHCSPYAVIGGAIENKTPRLINWALYFLDAGRYQNPIPEGPSDYVSDVNVSYKRKHLEAVRRHWEPIYHETGVHDALRRSGETLWLTPKLVVWQERGNVGLRRALKERFAWARLYAGRRSREISMVMRCVLVVGSPLLALVLPARAAKTSWVRGQHRFALVKALPIMILMSSVWAVGEFVGYLTGRDTKASRALEGGSVRVDRR